MNKKIFALFALSFMAVSCSNGKDVIGSSLSSMTESSESIDDLGPIQKTYKTRRESSIIADTNFRNGLYLISPKSTEQHFEKVIDYNGERETDYYVPDNEYNTYWSMCQWWTPFNFKDATYRKEGDTHIYENESRLLGVNTETGELRMRLDSDMEYRELFPETGLKANDASWSHFLIQQTFPNDIALFPQSIDDEQHSLMVSFDVRIDEATYMRDDTPIGSNCAQLMFYLLITNIPPEDGKPEEVGKRGTKMWFGLPLYDSRYDFVERYIGGDVGFQGATGHLIYSITNREYLDEKMQMGKTYHIELDVLEYLKEAFIYGAQTDFLKNCQWQNMYLNYMNFGWELPGNYRVDSTISNLDIYVEE